MKSKIVEYFNHDHRHNKLNQNMRKISPAIYKSEKYNNQVDLYQQCNTGSAIGKSIHNCHHI